MIQKEFNQKRISYLYHPICNTGTHPANDIFEDGYWWLEVLRHHFSSEELSVGQIATMIGETKC